MRVRIGLQSVLATWGGFAMVALGGGPGCSGGGASPPRGDSGVDASLQRDAASDAGADSSGDGGGCPPGSVAAFRPPAFVPIHQSTACTGFNGEGGLVQAYGDACIGHQKHYAPCEGFTVPDAAGAAECYNCLVTTENSDASTYGAVVVTTTPQVDYPGCLQFYDPSEAGTSCAQLITAAATCSEFACKATCPISDELSWNEFNDCYDEATTGACAGYWLSAEECIAAEEGDGGNTLASVCFGGMYTEDDYLSIAHHFCGGD